MLTKSALLGAFLLIGGLAGGCTNQEEKMSPHLHLGIHHLQSGQPEKAIGELGLAVEFQPLNLDARYRLGTAFLKAGKIGDGIRELDLAAALAPDRTDALFQASRILVEAGLFDESLERLGKLLSVKPAHPDAMLLAVDIHLARQEPDQAEAMVMRMVGEGMPRDLAFRAYSRIYGSMGQEMLAEGALLKALQHNFEEPENHRLLASCYLERQELEKAEKQLLGMAAEFPGLSWPLQELTLLYLEEGREKEAEQLLEVAVRRLPEDETFYMRLAGLHLRQPLPAGAAAVIKEALPRLGQPLGLKLLLADLFFGQHHFEAAEREVEQILALDNAYGPALLLKSKLLLQEGSIRQSLEVLDILVDDPLYRAEAFYYKAIVHYAAGELERSGQAAAAAVHSAPESPRFRALLARIYLMQGKHPAALDQAVAALELQPTNYRAALVLGESLLHAGERGMALEVFDRLSESSPSADIQLLHLKGHLLTGEETAAEEIFEQAIAFEP